MAKIETDLSSDIGGSVEKTSELINDGEFGNSRFVEESELPEIVEEIIEDLQINVDKNFVYEQTTPSKVWEYEHGLGKKPSVQVTDSAGTVMMGQITVNDGIRVRIEFNIAFWGYATNN